MNRFSPKKLLAAVLLSVVALGAHAQVGLPPIIAVQPIGVSVPQGGTTILTVVAVSATSMTYKWYRDGAVVGGATGSILILNNLNSGHAGNYQVEIKNSSGTTVSQNALVVVVPEVKRVLPVKSAKMKSTGFELQLDSLTNSTCVVYASTDMVNWSPIATNTVTAGATSYTDTSALSRPGRFYKVMDN